MNPNRTPRTVWKSAIREFPLTAVIGCLYIILSAVLDLWHPLWMIFLFIPLFYSLKDAIQFKNPHRFAYPLLCIIIFLGMGFFWNLWYPGWLVFLTIPLYYSLFISIKRRRPQLFAYPILAVLIYLILGLEWNLWHPGWAVFITIPVYYAIADWLHRFF